MTATMIAAVTFHRSTLLAALQPLARLAAKRASLPVLTSIRLVADGETATLEATDLDTWARFQVSCNGEGEALLPGSMFTELISRLSSDSVSLEIDGPKVTVRGGRSVTRITGMDPSDWPTGPQEETVSECEIEGDVFRHLAGVGYVASTEVTRPTLNGVYFHERDGKLAAVATDGHRLMLRESEVPAELRAILHGPGLSYALKLLEAAGQIRIRASERFVEMATDTATVTVRTIEGPYPNFDMIIPRDQDKIAVLNRRDWLDALRRLELVARHGETDKEPARITCAFDGDGLAMSAQRDSEAEEVVPVGLYTGDPLRIGFNVHYLIDLLGQTTAPTVELAMKAPERAATMRAGDRDGLFLVMPLRLLD